MRFAKLLLLFRYHDQESDKVYELAFVQNYRPSRHKVDDYGYDQRFGLPKIVLLKEYSVVPCSSVVRPVRLMPDFELEKEAQKREYFVRYNIDFSSLVDEFYEYVKRREAL